MMMSLKVMLLGFLAFSSVLYPTIVAADIGMTYEEGMQQQRDHANEQNAQAARNSGGPSTTNNQHLVDQLRNKGPNPNAPAVLSKVDTYIAVVLHPDADDPWAIWNTQDKNVGKRVLEYCEQAMGDKKCKIAGEGKNTAVAIGYKNNHLVDTATGKDPYAAKENLKKKCGSNCLVGAVFASHPVIQTDFVDADIKGYLPTKDAVRLKSQNALDLKPVR